MSNHPLPPKKVLVDSCVISLAETVQVASKHVNRPPWGDFEVTGFVGKAPRDKTQQFQRECLPTIAQLARNGVLHLYRTNEIDFEGWHRSRPLGLPRGDLFADIPFTAVPPAIERSRVQQGDIIHHAQGDALARFCKWLLAVDESALLSSPGAREHFAPQEVTNLGRLGRFRSICAGLSDTQCRDAFHLWSAELSGVDYFLTVDTKFINALTQTRKLDLPCKPVSPSELLNDLGVTEREPLPYEPGQFYDVFGQPG